MKTKIETLKEDLEFISTNENVHEELRARAKLYFDALPSTEGLLNFFKEVQKSYADVDTMDRDSELVEYVSNAIHSLTPEDVLKKANEDLAAAIKNAEASLSEAENIANEHGLSFSFSPAYGMGGWYEAFAWNPSSQSC